MEAGRQVGTHISAGLGLGPPAIWSSFVFMSSEQDKLFSLSLILSGKSPGLRKGNMGVYPLPLVKWERTWCVWERAASVAGAVCSPGAPQYWGTPCQKLTVLSQIPLWRLLSGLPKLSTSCGQPPSNNWLMRRGVYRSWPLASGWENTKEPFQIQKFLKLSFPLKAACIQLLPLHSFAFFTPYRCNC